MPDPLAVAITFGALGANVLATGLLLLFNPRSDAVRWYAAFLTAVSLWLLGQGAIATGTTGSVWWIVQAAGVQLMPALFVAASLAHVARSPAWLPSAVAAAGVLLLPVTVPALVGTPGVLTIAWHAAGWGIGSWLHVRRKTDDAGTPRAHSARGRLLRRLLIVPPILAAIGIAVAADRLFLYVMPLIIVSVHFGVFGGIVWLRFYDIEVRAARSGELAGRAAEAERLAAVGELAASIAHEVRNPLAGIRSLAQRLAEDDVDAERARRYATVIVGEAGRLDRIVANLLAIARRGSPRSWTSEPTSLATLFDDVVLLVSARAERAGVRIVARASAEPVAVPREPLAQALLNLVLNAITHSPAGGAVTLDARSSPGHGAVVVSVRDQGPGIPADQRERIFEPFHSAGTDGVGLGLSVVRRLARELGWRVEVRDAPGGGAEFRLTIGASAAAGAREPRTGEAEADTSPTAIGTEERR